MVSRGKTSTPDDGQGAAKLWEKIESSRCQFRVWFIPIATFTLHQTALCCAQFDLFKCKPLLRSLQMLDINNLPFVASVIRETIQRQYRPVMTRATALKARSGNADATGQLIL